MIGALKHRVTVQRLSEIDDGAGGTTEDWTNDFTAWASVTPLRSTNILQDNQYVLKDAFKIRMRWNKNRDISNKNRIKIRDSIYPVISRVEINHEKRFFEITVQDGD